MFKTNLRLACETSQEKATHLMDTDKVMSLRPNIDFALQLGVLYCVYTSKPFEREEMLSIHW